MGLLLGLDKGVVMRQAKFSITQSQIEFLNQYKQYGFKDKSSVVRLALQQLQEKLEREELKKSADLYAEVYAEDADLRELTEAAITGWPA